MATSLFANPIMVEDYVETSKQITKALKCVAFTNMQVGDMMLRKHERLEKRIFSISEEIELLKADVVENVVNQRERRQQLADIEDDIERAEVLGNALMVEELLEELKVLQDEGKREDALYRSLKKALRSRKRVRKEFIGEKKVVEDEMRSFNRKQNLIQSLLTTFAKDSGGGAKSLSSDASQSDAGSTMTDFDESEFSVGPHEPLVRRMSDASVAKQRWLYSPEPVRPRRWSADEPAPPKPHKHRVRVRRTLSANFAPSRPHSLGSVEEEDEENADEDDEAPTNQATSRSHPLTATATARTLTKSVSLPPQHHLFTEASTVARSVAAPAAAVRAAEPIELEEIHDEQDNYYSHASESSDESSDSDDDHYSTSASTTSVHTTATTTSATTATHDTVVIGAGVQSVLAHEMHTLKLSTEVAAAVASVKTTHVAVDASTETATTATTSSDQVEVALALSEMVQSISTTLAA